MRLRILLSISAAFPALAGEPLHRYSFNDLASGTLHPGTATDAGTDGTKHGTIWRAGFTGPDDAEHPGCLALDASSYGYVDLPNGIVSSLESTTIEIWATPKATNSNWARYWDFGTTDPLYRRGELDEIFPTNSSYDGTSFLMLTSNVYGNPRTLLQVTPPTGMGYTRAAMSTEPNTNMALVEHHIIAIYDPPSGTMELWFDGARVDRAAIDMPLSELPDVNAWIGRSNWSADAFFSGWFNEFRIYDAPLSPLQIAVNAAAGPDSLIADPGALQSLRFVTDNLNVGSAGATRQIRLIGDFENIAGVDLTALEGEVVWQSGEPDVIAVDPTGMASAQGAGYARITATYEGIEANATFAAGGAPLLQILPATDGIQLRWPTVSAATLQSSLNLQPSSWKVVESEPAIEGSWFTLDFPASAGAGYFRLEED